MHTFQTNFEDMSNYEYDPTTVDQTPTIAPVTSIERDIQPLPKGTLLLGNADLLLM